VGCNGGCYSGPDRSGAYSGFFHVLTCAGLCSLLCALLELGSLACDFFCDLFCEGIHIEPKKPGVLLATLATV